MDEESRRRHAGELLQQAYSEQMSGNLDEAIRLYKAPTYAFAQKELAEVRAQLN